MRNRGLGNVLIVVRFPCHIRCFIEIEGGWRRSYFPFKTQSTQRVIAVRSSRYVPQSEFFMKPSIRSDDLVFSMNFGWALRELQCTERCQFHQKLSKCSRKVNRMMLFNMHSVPSEVVIRFPPDVSFSSEYDRIDAIFRIDRYGTIFKTMAHPADRNTRERVAKVHYHDALLSQCAITVIVKVSTAQLCRLTCNVKSIYDQHIKLTRAALYELGSILTKDFESVVIIRNEEPVSELNYLGTNLRNADLRVRQIPIAMFLY